MGRSLQEVLLTYPKCLTEWETVEAALAGRNLARYGDGEFSIIVGGNCISQVYDAKLAKELAEVLVSKNKRTLPCLPTPYGGTPKQKNWLKFTDKQYIRNLDMGRTYGSAFITRPDSAPWIDTTEYWDLCTSLWRGKDITLVYGTLRSLRPDVLRPQCNTLREVSGATKVKGFEHRDAYSEIGRIEEEIGTPSGTVLLCLGPAATVLSDRLAKKDVHAVDVGHLGMFMRHAGGYRYQLDDLSTPGYRNLLESMHKQEGNWGNSGHSWAKTIDAFCTELNATVILDYGCGQGSLHQALNRKGLRVTEFDIGRPDRRGMPKPVDITVSTDVLEHVELEKLTNVIDHIFSISAMGVFLNISLRKAKRILPDGRNAHLIIQDENWWLEKLKREGWKHYREPEIKSGNKMILWFCREGQLIPCLGVKR